MSRLAWLTPDIGLLTNPLDCRTITVPGDLFYLVTGALELLAEEESWEKYGTATPEDTAVFFRDIIDAYCTSSCGGGMNLLSTLYGAYSGSGGSGNPTQIQLLKTSMPSEMGDAVGVLANIKSSVDVERIMTIFPYGNASLQAVVTLQPGDNQWGQILIPMDDLGAKINIGGFGVPTYWSYDISFIGWW